MVLESRMVWGMDMTDMTEWLLVFKYLDCVEPGYQLRLVMSITWPRLVMSIAWPVGLLTCRQDSFPLYHPSFSMLFMNFWQCLTFHVLEHVFLERSLG